VPLQHVTVEDADRHQRLTDRRSRQCLLVPKVNQVVEDLALAQTKQPRTAWLVMFTQALHPAKVDFATARRIRFAVDMRVETLIGFRFFSFIHPGRLAYVGLPRKPSLQPIGLDTRLYHPP